MYVKLEPPRSNPKFTLEDNVLNMYALRQEEASTIYFALREYRDKLHRTLEEVLYKNLDADDYRKDDYLEHVDHGQPLTDFVPDVHMRVMLNECTDYEEMMFLFETLSRINRVLYDMTQQGSEEDVTKRAKWMDVI